MARASARTNFFPAALGEPAETLAEFLLQHYAREAAPAEIVINQDLPDHERVAEALVAVAGRACSLHRGRPRAAGSLARAGRGERAPGAAHARQPPRCSRAGSAGAGRCAAAAARAGAHRVLRHQPHGRRGHGGRLASCSVRRTRSSATIVATTSRASRRAMTTRRSSRRWRGTARASWPATCRGPTCC